jgi:hypothetical protein
LIQSLTFNNVKAQYDELDRTEQLAACIIVCSRLANVLDSCEKGKPLPQSVSNVGKFLQYAQAEDILVAVRRQITVARILRFDLDEHPDWEPAFNKVYSKVDSV